jgi:hypothetical protein
MLAFIEVAAAIIGSFVKLLGSGRDVVNESKAIDNITQELGNGMGQSTLGRPTRMRKISLA